MNKSEFKKAVADNEAPTAGYLYRDMAQWTYADYATQQQLIHALFDKLQAKNSAFVLYKALHLIKVLCETGHEGFQKELQLSKYTGVLKDFTTYRGLLDIKYGDSWNIKVRREAEAALEAVFQTRTALPAGPSGIEGTHGGDWRGCGSTLQGGEAPGGGPWGSNNDPRMPSFASSSAQPLSSSADTLSSHIGEMPTENRFAQEQQRALALGQAGIASSSSAKQSKTLLQQLASTAKSSVNLITQFEVLKGKQERLYGDQFGQAARASTGPASGGGGSFARKRGGADDVGSYQPVGLSVPLPAANADLRDTSVACPWQAPSPEPCTTPAPHLASSPPPATHEVSGGAPAHDLFAASPWSDAAAPLAEPAGPTTPAVAPSASAVEDLIHSLARMKQTPTRVDLSRMVRAMDTAAAGTTPNGTPVVLMETGETVANAICTHLTREKPWQERLNALACLEAALRGCPAAWREALTRCCLDQSRLVQENYNVVQASLKEKAGKVAQLLGVPAVAPADTFAAAVATSSPLTVGDAHVAGGSAPRSHFESLLGDAPPLQPVPAAHADPGVGSDTFEGMTIRSGTASSSRRGGQNSEAFFASTDERSGGRPLRRTNAAPASDVQDTLWSAPAPRGPVVEPVPGRQIQILRSSAQANPLDDLLGASSPSPDRTAPSPLPTNTTPSAAASALDDLFGNGPGSSAPTARSAASLPPTSNAAVTADDLFATPAPAPLTSHASSSTAQLVRIQSLMTYLETRYDPAAMAELEKLIMDRQQRLQQLAQSQDGSEHVNEAALRGAQAVHSQFQTGSGPATAGSERPRPHNALADVQAEMKRQMEL